MRKGCQADSAAAHAGKPGSILRAAGSIRPIPWLAGGLLLAGCVSGPERDLRARYREADRVVHEVPAATDRAPRFDEDSTLDDYLQHAFAQSPGLRAAFDRWKAGLERIPPARSLDDPALSFEYFIEQQDTRYQMSVTQAFPLFGKRGLREKRAAAEAEAAMHAFETERLALFDRVVKAFYEYQYLARATQVTEETHRLLVDLEEDVASRYRAGVAPFSALVKIQVERDRLASELATLRDERAPRSAGLAALLNLPVHATLPWPKASPSGSAVVDTEALDDLLEELNPELKAAASMVAAETYRAQLARKSGLPELMLGASWMVMRGMEGEGDETEASLMAGVTLPLWRGRYRAETREADALRRAAANERDAMRNLLRAELSMAIFKVRDAERRVGLFAGSLIPKAAQALEVAKQEFAAGKVDLMTLIDAERTWLEFRLGLERATADREIALGEIGCCVGKYDVGVGRTGPIPRASARGDEGEGAGP